jgi:DNA helicase II / ATP-dependent DNA helicase PcrA
MTDSRLFLVHGPPGTGKTTYLARQAQAAAAKHGGSQVAAVSLTRTAAAEIAGRDTAIPDENVGTLHAHCYRALDRPQLAETPEGIRAWNDEHPALALSSGSDQLEDAPPDADAGRTSMDALHAQVMTQRARMAPPEMWTAQQRDYLAAWTRWKQRTERLDFTDLIEQCLRDVTRHPVSPSVLLLDEAQDFSRLELALAVKWSAHTDTTVIVADPDQSIYVWRGADPAAFAQLPLAGRRVLEQSHRVPRAVHALADRWLGLLGDRRSGAAYHPTAVDGSADRHPAALCHPEQLLATLEDDLAGDSTCMLLASCGYMLTPLLAVLRDRGIPFHNPYRAKAGAWNPLRAANRLLAFLRPSQRAWGDAARPWTWDDLRLWTEPLAARDALARGAKALIEAKCRADQFGESQADGQPGLDTVCDLLGVAADSIDHPALRGDVDWWAHMLRANQRAKFAYPLEVLRRHGAAALRERPRLTIGTIHSVKGGEADSVYVFPDLSRAGAYDGWHRGGPGRDQIVRMFYVALTRARARVTVLDPSGPEHVALDAFMPIPQGVAA